MTYQEAVRYLESLIDYERSPAGAAAARSWNLDRMRQMLRSVGDPHLGLRCLHIAGTKGKGSTAAVTASILHAAGLRAGLYTSPHLISFRERIRVDGEMIPEDDVAALTTEVELVIESARSGEHGPPSFFEAYTLIALLHFALQRVDIGVIETGLGGRLDATNVIAPLACAITHIGLDHTQELGDTIPQIAREKAGIIKQGVPVISAPQVPEALEVLEEVCLERRAQLIVVGQEPGPRFFLGRADHRQQSFTIHGMRAIYGDLECPLLGAHQAQNSAVAVGLVELVAERGIGIGEEAIRAGVKSVRWPGRFQIVRHRPTVVLDGAHDEASAAALAAALRSLYPGKRIILVLGVGTDKDAEAIAARFCPLADRVISTASSSPRALPAHDLQQIVFRHCAHTAAYTPVSLAVREALDQARRNDVVVVTGSLYVVGEAMRALGVAEPDQ
jgi:dihydrofolate synthase/folylpolyglutamate synthase